MTWVLFVGGPSGTGKSTVGQLLSSDFNSEEKSCFIEGDEWHTQSNIDKMRNNIPLTDADRWPWLEKLTELAVGNSYNYDVVVITCSMLKKSYRDFLISKVSKYDHIDRVSLIILHNTFENVLMQMKDRKNHFFKESMLKSQYDIFELPDYRNESNVYIIDCNNKTPQQLVICIKQSLTRNYVHT
jgi:gluconokinase